MDAAAEIQAVVSGEKPWAVMSGDALSLLPQVPDGCVSAVITDPPYGTTDCEWDRGNDVGTSNVLWNELLRVTPRSAAIVMTACGQFMADLIVARRSLYRYKWVWCRGRPTGALDANRRPMRVHEDVLVFARAQPEYNAVKHRGPAVKRSLPGKSELYRNWKPKHVRLSAETEYHPTDVVLAAPPPTGPDRVHPTQKPLELMSLLVRSYAREGQIVLDPFSGSGSTGVAAVLAGRRFIGFERDERYARIAAERIRVEAGTLFATHTHTHTHNRTRREWGRRRHSSRPRVMSWSLETRHECS